MPAPPTRLTTDPVAADIAAIVAAASSAQAAVALTLAEFTQVRRGNTADRVALGLDGWPQYDFWIDVYSGRGLGWIFTIEEPEAGELWQYIHHHGADKRNFALGWNQYIEETP
jgi:hypothetical protein